jgi:hypothetical protein
MKYLHSENSFDLIRNFILGKIETLPDSLDKMRQRWISAFAMMSESGIKSDREVCIKLMEVYEITDETAYRDIAASKRLFGDARKSSKDAERYLASETAKENYQKAMTMFLATKKYHWYVAAVFQQKIHAKVNGLDKDDPDLPDPSKINPPVQILQINVDFIRSHFAQFIDPKAKDRINALMAQIDDLVQNSRIGDYLNTTIEIPRIKDK